MGFVKSRDRKKSKYKNILKRSFNVHLADQPTETVAVCNGGLANGLTQEQLIQHFGQFGEIECISQPIGHTVSFVRFTSVESAMLACESPASLSWQGCSSAFIANVERLPEADNLDDSFKFPPGLIIVNNIITEAEEKKFLECVASNPESELKNRRVKHFGFEFQYSDNRAGSIPVESIPVDFNVLWPRMLEETGLNFVPDQCTVNKYAPGDGIPPHVDTHSAFTEFIVSLSMESDVVMDWRKGDTIRHTVLPRRSLCIMTKESRYGWTHGITPRKSDVIPNSSAGLTIVPRSSRTSVTFRKKREGDCECSFEILCDTAILKLKNSPTNVTEAKAADFENCCVHEVYEKIADHFSETRHKPWPNVVQFLTSFMPGSLIIDVGCGNGKYLGSGKNVALLGCDRSGTLAQVCRDRGHEVFVCDCLSIPIRDDFVDGCISIAVLHHLSTEDRRLRGIKEMMRILRPGGRALIYVWAKNQETNLVKSNYLKQKKIKQSAKVEAEPTLANVNEIVLPVHTNRTNFHSSDMFVPWQKKPLNGIEGSTFLRYYHVFEDSELQNVCEQIERTNCIDYYYDQGNWCIILEKAT